MNAEIEFGQVEHSEPERGLRPDEDKHFVVAECGTVGDHDLPIYVDMDVLRDMEAHARENTRVELGGVMLGRHHIDSNGNPFVTITDSLRAKHYEATKGSFKFTHDTWNQITRERNEYRSELEMVGWYHTHPGWGVFLSGMDLFICNNFFNRPLDVALVIDPCAGDRGWFQWDSGKTRETPGFYLMTNRHRQSELNYFADIFSQQSPDVPDPRFRQPAFSNDNSDLGDTMVNVIDNRRPVFEFAIISMLFLQLLVAGLIGWRMVSGPQIAGEGDLGARVAELESTLEETATRQQATVREQTYSEIVDRLVTAETGQSGLADHYAEVAGENRLLNANLEGQLARLEKFDKEKNELTFSLKQERKRSKTLESDLGKLESAAKKLLVENKELKKLSDESATDEAVDEEDSLAKYFPAWLLYTCGGISLFVIGLLGGSMVTRLQEQQEDDDFDEAESNSSDRQEQPDGAAEGDANFGSKSGRKKNRKQGRLSDDRPVAKK